MFALAQGTAPCARARGEPSGDGEPFMDLAKFIDKIVARFIGTKHERDIKKLMPVIAAINALETGAGSGVGGGVGGPGDGGVRSLSDEALRARFAELRAQVQEQLKDADPAESAYKEQLQQALEPAIVPAFALVREAGRRFLNMRHFDVQLIGGIVLHEGKISEMKTGEGKTLVATLPAVLNALAGRGVHIVTVNDYLARRDAEWMSPLYKALGLSVGVIVHDLDDEPRRLWRGHYLRHQQRIRLRLSARQHEVRSGAMRSARTSIRHRRRSGLHPHRRSAYPSDYFRPIGRIHR